MFAPQSFIVAVVALAALVAPSQAAVIKKQTNPSISAYTNIFAFGDSYSAYGLGRNRPLIPVDRIGLTYSGGPTWVEYLGNMTAGGEAGVWNIAQGGATIDGNIVNSGYATVQDFGQQVEVFMEQFYYGTMADWDPATTLFTVWFGTNDVILPLIYNISVIPYLTPVFASFTNDISTLYYSGARHFLIPNVASLQYTPHAMARDAVGLKALYKQQVTQWNAAYKTLIKTTLPKAFPLATFTYVDAYSIMEPVMVTPTKYGFPGLGYCPGFGTLVDVDDPNQTFPGCTYPLSSFLWWNDFHFSSTAQKLMANLFASAIKGTATKREADQPTRMKVEKRSQKGLGWRQNAKHNA